VQLLGGASLDEADLILAAARAAGDQTAGLVGRLETEVLQETVGDREVRHS
jgi:hypothetical protein